MKNLILLAAALNGLYATGAFARETAQPCSLQLEQAASSMDPRAFFGGDCTAKHVQIDGDQGPEATGSFDLVCEEDGQGRSRVRYEFYIEPATCRVLDVTPHSDGNSEADSDDHNGCFKHPGNHCL